MTSQFRMSQTMLRFVRLLYFLQHEEADMRKAVIFLTDIRRDSSSLNYHVPMCMQLLN